MSTIFTKIVNREIPAHVVAEDEHHIAFLDINPLVEGHLLVVPKKEVDYLFDLSDDEYLALQLFAKKVALALKKAIPCVRIGTAVIGLDVPHTHIHLVPLNEMNDINFARPKMNPTNDQLAATANKIAKEFE